MSLKRIAVIGAGVMGGAHVGYISESAECELAAVAAIADVNPRVAELASAKDVPFFSTHTELLEKIRPDGVLIATPNDSHVSIALDCVAKGLPTLVEKPVAVDQESGLLLAEAAEKTTYRFWWGTTAGITRSFPRPRRSSTPAGSAAS